MYSHEARVHAAYMAKKAIRPQVQRRDRVSPEFVSVPEPKVISRLKPDPPYKLTFIRQHRESQGLTLERLADRVGEKTGGMSHATLSRIERGLQPWSQPVLEAIAEALGTDVVSLLIRDPKDPDAIWSIWDQAKPAERKMIVDIARTIIKTGT